MLSVIIPTYNEELFIEKCISSVKKVNPLEIILVDGGSNDKTIDIANSLGAKVLLSEKGRGKQLEKGIQSAKGDLVLILHSDTMLSDEISSDDFNLEDDYCGGFFKLKYDSRLLPVKLVEIFANIRSFLHSLPYGDQAIFVKKSIIKKIGGIRDYPFLEDLDLVLRLRKTGRLKGINKNVIVSARKLTRKSFFYPISHSLKNVFIVLLFLIGFSPNKLIKFYK